MADTLILVPGLGCDRRLWAQQIVALDAGRRIVVADQTRHDRIADMARALLETAPPRFAIAGLSMGGYVVLEVLRQAPQRIDRLALIDTNAHADTPESTARRQAQIERAAKGGYKAVVNELTPLLVAPAHAAVPAVADVYRAMALDTGAEAFIRQQRAIVSRADSRGLLGGIAVPSLVLCGEHDALSPPNLHREMAAAIPGAVLEVVPRAGHLAPLEAPVPVTAAMARWLQM
ncbi:MAG: alpha/beta fold hydrolase [Alphaproteobacteria bacterium]|nr:MAG: alpha/beta fold hydrolase [Alphaproteobacteria bacterium]